MHPDPDVRKVADQVLYVLQAPELVLEKESTPESAPTTSLSPPALAPNAASQEHTTPPSQILCRLTATF